MNQAARELLAVPADTAVGQPLASVSAELHAALAPLGAREWVRRGEVEVKNAEGRDMVLGISVSPLVDHQDRVHGRIVSFQDLSELRAMEAQVKSAERLATIGTVAAGVAHELRNPLASISGSIELLRSGAESDRERDHLMEIVTREVARLDGLVAELLDYTNPRPRESVRFDLIELAEETLRVFARDRKVEGVSVRLAKPSDARPIEVVADPAKLRQVLWNLLRNAAQAAHEGGGHVAIELYRGQDEALIDVSDDGPGIADDKVSHIFEPFFTTRAGGTGLGLAIVRSIVEEHDGEVDVDTRPGRGTTFSVRLPLAAPADPAQPRRAGV
jgi:two-component system sensor histidine kinase PilS (NtrC family)